MAEPQKGDIAFHLVMALCADLAIHDEPRLARIREMLAGMLDHGRAYNRADRADLQAAHDALLP